MQRVFSRLVLIAGLGGCVAPAGDESFVIVDNLALGMDGLFTPSLSGPFISAGNAEFVDERLFVGSMFQSRIVAPEGKESLKTIFVHGANIQLDVGQFTFEKNNVLSTTNPLKVTYQFQLPFSSAVTPNSGLAVGVYDLIPADIMADLRSVAANSLTDPNTAVRIQIISTTTAFGDYYGDRIDATPFIFPVFIDHPATCGDLVCDPTRFEDLITCPRDCICGNGVCDTTRGETTMSCPDDCPPP